MPDKQELTARRIARILWETGCITIRPKPSFRWASGLVSPIYTDNRLLLGHPKERDAIIRTFIQVIRRKRLSFDRIAGVATSAIPLASILADRLKKPLIYVRPQPKGHGKGRQIEGELKRGDRVLLIEDLVSTGGSSLAAVSALRKRGARLTHVLATFVYLPEEMGQCFRKQRCTLINLTDTERLLSVGLRKKGIGPRHEKAVQTFLEKLRQKL